jgi:uncharacterized protein YdaU (DUF1376 family)
MAQFPSLPLWTDAYLGDTTHLTTLEHGAYLLLLIVAWRSPHCRLPNDDKMLARYTKLTSAKWKTIKPIILEFFEEKDGFLYQGRLTDEKCFVNEKSIKQSRAAKARWLKTKETDDATAMPRQCQNDAKPMPPHPHPSPHLKKNSGKPSVDKNNGEGPPLKTLTHEQAREIAPGYDIYFIENQWREGGYAAKARNPDKAFIGFLKRHIKNNPL